MSNPKAKTNGKVDGQKPNIVGRDDRGRFLSGHPYKSPGRPKGISAESYIETFKRNCSQADFADVIAALVSKAKTGHAESCRILVDRILPTLSANLNIDVDGELRLAGASPDVLGQEMLVLFFGDIERQKRLAQQMRGEEVPPDAPSILELAKMRAEAFYGGPIELPAVLPPHLARFAPKTDTETVVDAEIYEDSD